MTSSMLASIWLPQLTFHNSRDFIRPMDFHCSVFNNGMVILQQRFIHAFAARMDARRFPFDSQNFTVIVRSAKFDRRSVVFNPMDSGLETTRRTELLPPSDGNWEFNSLQQVPLNQSSNIYARWQFLGVTVRASRIATYGMVVLLFPGIAICIAQIVAYFIPLKSDARISICVTGLLAIITFNFVLVQLSPPVSYMTKMTMLSVCAMSICLFNLIVQAFFRSVYFAAELLRKEGKGKEAKDGEAKTNGDYVELATAAADKHNPLHQVSVFCCLKISQSNRMVWLHRLILWNEVARIVFATIVLIVLLAVIFS